MKTTKQFVSLTIMCVIILATFPGCKKGEDDPFISLRSRKARVAGEWTVSQMEGESSETFSGNTYNCTESFGGGMYTKTCLPGTPTTINGTWTLNFEKDGSYSSRLEFSDSASNIVINFEGTWTFLSGVGDKKNKEQLAVTSTKTTTEVSSQGGTPLSILWTGKERTYNVWDIKSLKSKEMLWYLKTAAINPNSSSEATYNITLTKN